MSLLMQRGLGKAASGLEDHAIDHQASIASNHSIETAFTKFMTSD